jgi:small subunit ribosomal protein S17
VFCLIFRSNRPRRVRTTAEERSELRKKSAAARKRRRGETGGGEYVRTPAADAEQGTRRERRGVVTSNKGEKTITVRVDVLKAHPKYKKIMRRSMTLHAHDEQNAANIGDIVRVVETRPLSRTKRWRLVEIVEVAK